MKHYIHTDPATGRITGAGTCPDSATLPDGALLTERYLLGFAGYLQDGQVVELPPQVAPGYVFDWALKQWIDPRTLQDLRGDKWSEIKAARSAAEYGGFTWDGSTFDSDAASQARIQGAVQIAGMTPGTSLDWTLQDNTVRTLSAADIDAVGLALGQHVAAQFGQARSLRDRIEAATTLEELNLITWNANA